MKIKNLIELIGFRSKPRQYRYAVKEFKTGFDKPVRYAQWLHPRETAKTLTAEMVTAYQEFLNEGDFCIDIGAHTGDSTLPMALAVGTKGCVLALEPNPYVYHVLEKNARLNPEQTHIKTLMAAATPEEQFIEFEYSDSGFCNGGRHENISSLKHGHSYKLSVFGINLSNELNNDFAAWLNRLKFIKVDAEGFDLYILQSIADILKTYKPYIKAEVFKNTDEKYREDLFSFLSDTGYKIYRVTEEPVRHDNQEMHLADMNQWKHFDIICLPEEK